MLHTHIHTQTTLPTRLEYKSPVRGHTHRTTLPQDSSTSRRSGDTHRTTLPTRLEYKSPVRGHTHSTTLPTRLAGQGTHKHTEDNPCLQDSSISHRSGDTHTHTHTHTQDNPAYKTRVQVAGQGTHTHTHRITLPTKLTYTMSYILCYIFIQKRDQVARTARENFQQ